MYLSACLLVSFSYLPASDMTGAEETVVPVRKCDHEYTINTRDFLLPIHVDPDRKDEIQGVILHLSTDGGRTWREVDTISPDKEGFEFHAKGKGLYWFTLQVVGKNKVKEPADVNKEGRITQVRVEIAKETTSAKATDSKPAKMPYAD